MSGRACVPRLVVVAVTAACAAPVATVTAASQRVPVPAASPAAPVTVAGAALQLVVVTTASWDTTGGTLRRYERDASGDGWRAVGGVAPVVVGRTGLAWDGAAGAPSGVPVKREGDGRAPAGMFPLDTAFGFASASQAGWVRLPYVALRPSSECVDDGTSVHYNTVVDRDRVTRVDWNSAERMRQIAQYRLGVIVAYNRPPHSGRGSCIFLHVWAGQGTSTAGCTAMAEGDLRALLLWADPARHPALVQLPEAEYARLRASWRLP